MSNNEQSSVDWFANRIKHLIPDDIGSQLFLKSQQSKAKAMHKEETINAILDNRNITSQVTFKDAQQYYNETFGGNND